MVDYNRLDRNLSRLHLHPKLSFDGLHQIRRGLQGLRSIVRRNVIP